MLDQMLDSSTAEQRQIQYGEATQYTHFPTLKANSKRKVNWKRGGLIALLGAGALLYSGVSKSHEEPDFSKLPDTYLIERHAVANNLLGFEVGRMPIGHGTMFKVGEKDGVNYYATANHLNKVVVPKPTNPINIAHAEWYANGRLMRFEIADEKNDTMILSTTHDFGDDVLPICQEPTGVGDQTYVYAYHRGHLGLSEGRIGDLESKVMGDGKNYYHSDSDVLPGASGAPHLKYEDGDFCVFGMVLGNISGGYFGVSSSIDSTVDLYNKLLETK